MAEILTRAGCFIAIIVLGLLLRRFGFFKEGDFHVISRIVIRDTPTEYRVVDVQKEWVEEDDSLPVRIRP